MAKHKRRPLRASKATSTQQDNIQDDHQRQSATIIHPSRPLDSSQKRRRGIAHQKKAQQPQPTKPTLGDRFHALPAELRAEIFSHLLVRPVKWQLPHNRTPEACALISNSWTIYPEIGSRMKNTCMRCFTDHWRTRIPLWRGLQDRDESVEKWNRNAAGLGLRVWQNPWRSQWAPKVANEFICSDCWDQEFRPKPNPAQENVGGKSHLRCLCARRQDLGVFLVCKQWNEEAGAVFYTRNTFAFESAAVFTAFITSLPRHWREKVTRVSLMAYHTPEPQGPEEEYSGWESNRRLRGVWPLLHQLPRLSYLELDAHFLTRAKIAHRLLKLSLRNVRRVCFVMHNVWPSNTSEGSKWVWPEYHCSRLLVGGFAEEVSRGIKGQKPRRSLLRPQSKALEVSCERMAETEAATMALDSEAHEEGMLPGNIYDAASISIYNHLWWEEEAKAGFAGSAGSTHTVKTTNARDVSGLNNLHAYIPTPHTHFHSLRHTTRDSHWRSWISTTLYSDDFSEKNTPRWRVMAGWNFLSGIDAKGFLWDDLVQIWMEETENWLFEGSSGLEGMLLE